MSSWTGTIEGHVGGRRAWDSLRSIIVAGLLEYTPMSSTPWLLAVAAMLLWWRGPGWRAIGLRRPANVATLAGHRRVVGVGYQYLGLYLIEPHNRAHDIRRIARCITLPSARRQRSAAGVLVGNVVDAGGVHGRDRVSRLDHKPAGRALAILDKRVDRRVLLSSALFGVVHLYQGVSGMIARGSADLSSRCVYLATDRNLWASILAHGFMDTVGFLMIYFGVYPGL